jgi:O-methyltransferase involved in polyketide biosynthesis
MDSKISMDMGGVQRTLIIPLWGRSVFGALYPDILYDRQAIEIV